MSFGLSLDARACSGVTEDEETTVTSSPVEAVRSGGVMERLIYGTGSFPGCCCGLLHPHCSQQPADISDPAKMHKHNTKTVILNSTISFAFCISSNKMSLLYIFVSGIPLFSTNAAVTLPCRSCSTTEDLQQRCCNNANCSLLTESQ